MAFQDIQVSVQVSWIDELNGDCFGSCDFGEFRIEKIDEKKYNLAFRQTGSDLRCIVHTHWNISELKSHAHTVCKMLEFQQYQGRVNKVRRVAHV